MTCRIGINGFGRIGRMVVRRALTLPEVEVVAVNDLARIGDLAYLLKYDSVHGLFPGEVSHDDHVILVHGKAMQFSSEKDPAKIPWGQAGVDVVIESSGAFRGRKDATGHLRGGARKVLISAPSDDVDVTLVPGVNDAHYDAVRHHVLSMASCTTNSLAPVAKVLHEHFGIARLLITTVHAYTSSQSIMDKPTRKRRGAGGSAVDDPDQHGGRAGHGPGLTQAGREGRRHGDPGAGAGRLRDGRRGTARTVSQRPGDQRPPAGGGRAPAPAGHPGGE